LRKSPHGIARGRRKVSTIRTATHQTGKDRHAWRITRYRQPSRPLDANGNIAIGTGRQRVEIPVAVSTYRYE
jgi:hypothetical protein